ncbi:MAG: sugar phosphate isomerase/epimerase family protein [Candidatus Rifleibacteriota bacterium]
MNTNLKTLRIGNQTNCHIPAMLPFEFALKHNFDAFEWFSDPGRDGWNEKLFDNSQLQNIREQGRKNDIRFSVHAPWRADPTCENGRNEILESISFAEKIGAGLVNFHIFPEKECCRYVEAIIPLLQKASAAKIQLSLENVPQCSPEYINQLFEILQNNSQFFSMIGLCLDIGHANLFPETRRHFNEYLRRISGNVKILHLHAHENFGDTDQHLPLFTGPSASDENCLKHLVSQLKERAFAGSVVMEQWPQPPEILVKTRKRLLEIWNDGG